MAGATNRGKLRALDFLFRGTAFGGGANSWAVFLATSAVAPSSTINTKTELTEIATGNGYSAGGIALARNSTDFDTVTELDSPDLRGSVQIRDLSWTAAGGPVPATGGGARYAILTDGHATVASREAWAFWDLGADRSITDGQTLTLQDAELRLTE